MKKITAHGGLRLKNKKSFLSIKPKFSIITVVLNDKPGLKKTIKSILKQKFRNFEYLIIDGGSTDGTLNLLKKYNGKIDYWISKKDKGIWDAVNKGILLSKGKYVNTINAGDTYHSKNSLTIINDYFEKDDTVDFIFGTVKKNKVYHKYEPKKMFWSFNFYPAHSGGFFVKRIIHKKIGLYNLKYKCSSDYDFFWRLINKYRFKGTSTKKNELISNFKLGGFSSKYSFFQHVLEETHIRMDNGQNKIVVITIFLLRCIKNFYKL